MFIISMMLVYVGGYLLYSSVSLMEIVKEKSGDIGPLK
jgi:hypothetical protein